MNLHKTHPEAHDAWLYAMGIDVRWRHRSAHGEDVVPTLPQGQAVTENIVVPTALSQARCWVVGTSPLSTAERSLLAGMLWSVGLKSDEVIYCAIDELAGSMVVDSSCLAVPSFPAWPQLRETRVSSQVLRQLILATSAQSHAPSVWAMGCAELLAVGNAGVVSLPTLLDLMHSPQIKQSIWAQLKILRVRYSA